MLKKAPQFINANRWLEMASGNPSGRFHRKDDSRLRRPHSEWSFCQHGTQSTTSPVWERKQRFNRRLCFIASVSGRIRHIGLKCQPCRFNVFEHHHLCDVRDRYPNGDLRPTLLLR
jgi:hypothetical protein